jgi:hypothetical protein
MVCEVQTLKFKEKIVKLYQLKEFTEGVADQKSWVNLVWGKDLSPYNLF